MSEYSKAFKDYMPLLLKHEGGFSNDPSDHGGATKYGISIVMDRPVLTQILGRPPTVDDIKDLTVEQATDIFYRKYWKPMRLDEVSHPGCQLILFDMCVLRGLRGATVMAQEVLNQTLPGVMPQDTLDGINGMKPELFCSAFLDRCEARFRKRVEDDPSQAVFLKGWLNRTNNLRKLVGVA